jgi:hypothetical protein
MSAVEIKSVISALPEKDRADLAAWLLDSLTEHSDDDALAESIAEPDRRLDELKSGQANLISEGEFWSRIERKC